MYTYYIKGVTNLMYTCNVKGKALWNKDQQSLTYMYIASFIVCYTSKTIAFTI